MPSEKILSEKQAYVAALREKLMNSVAGVVVEYKGISVADDTKLRALKAGYMEGQVMDVDAVSAIAKLPDREGMLSMFAGALTSTLSGLAVAMQAYVDKQEEPAA